MSPKLFLKTIALSVFTLFALKQSKAQCHACTDPAPYTGQQVCGLPAPTINQPSATCLAASACSGSSYDYTINFPSKVKAFFIYVTGGNILNRYITADIISQPYTAYPCTPPKTTNEFGTDNGNVIYSVRLNIRWTNNTTNYIEVYGYTGPADPYQTATVAYYKCFSIAAPLTVPATPASVGLSSPVCYSNPKGWLLGNQSSPGATSYTWSGSASGTYTTVTGPFVTSNQTVNVCVVANNGCGTSAARCSTFYVPNVCGGFRPIAGTLNGQSQSNDDFASDINIYPNPAQGNLNIYLKKTGKFTVEIISSQGQVLKKADVTGQQKLNIDVSGVSKGIYLVTIRQNGLEIEKRKIIIQ